MNPLIVVIIGIAITSTATSFLVGRIMTLATGSGIKPNIVLGIISLIGVIIVVIGVTKTLALQQEREKLIDNMIHQATLPSS